MMTHQKQLTYRRSNSQVSHLLIYFNTKNADLFLCDRQKGLLHRSKMILTCIDFSALGSIADSNSPNFAMFAVSPPTIFILT